MAGKPAMRLFLLPISTRRSLIYCEPIPISAASKPSYLDRAVNKANTTWAGFEKDSKSTFNWKKRLTDYGNLLFRRIPFEEWGLKTIPAQPKPDPTAPAPAQKQSVQVHYPALYQRLTHSPLAATLHRIAHDRQGLHATRLRWSIIGMPFTAPVAILPVIPNIPFFYLCFRAYSHWTALRGARHLAHLLDSGAVKPVPSGTLDALYTAGLLYPSREASREGKLPTAEQTREIVDRLAKEARPHGTGSHVEGQIGGHKKAELRAARHHQTLDSDPASSKETAVGKEAEDDDVEEVLLLKGWNGKLIAEKLGLPGLEVEIERAVEQVEKGIAKAKEEEKRKEAASAQAKAQSAESEKKA